MRNAEKLFTSIFYKYYSRKSKINQFFILEVLSKEKV